MVERYAEAIQHVDTTISTLGANARTGVIYLPGFKSLNERPAVVAIDQEWERLHPGERPVHLAGVPYPTKPPGGELDHVITSTGNGGDQEEWGIEVKRLQFFGDNGKRNDYATAKVLSPYLKDRGMLHDALRLRAYGFTSRVAIIGYSFDYADASLSEARSRHAGVAAALPVLGELSLVLKGSGPLRPGPLIEFADSILRLRGFTHGPRAQAPFEAWRHPAGGRGVVFGWEIRRPSLEPDFDARHPW